MKPSIQKTRDFFYSTHEDESGAVVILCLAAVLALMAMAWVVFDAHRSVNDKIMLQGAADTAAFSHASVEARSMNMIAYGNIAKRSIIDIHAMYTGMYVAYMIWIAKKWSECNIPYNIPACVEAAINTAMWLVETASDTSTMSSIIFGSGGLTKKAYLRDMQAIDNYQHYLFHVTPWWGFSEQLVRGWRNGATAVVSFPPPPGEVTNLASTVQQAINTINGFLQQLGMKTIDLQTFHGNDNLPIKKTSFGGWDWIKQLNPVKHPAFTLEHLVNGLIHKDESQLGAASGMTFGLGLVLSIAAGIPNAASKFKKYDDPYLLDSGGSEAEWLKRTSNLAFAYLNDPKRTTDDRNKFTVSNQTYNHSLTGALFSSVTYDTSGYWTMAKSEIVFADGKDPDMWHPSWTARMRPVHLPGEFEDANFAMFEAYSQIVPYLALNAQLGSIQGNQTGAAALASMKDIISLGFSTAAMGPTTASGVAK